MVEKSKKQKKGFVSEEDISTLLQRYSATTVLTLLQEVAQMQDVKIDWNALVEKTKTGISTVREYQMLWRHLAYRDSLLDRFDKAAQPLDDDSDLEYELEAFPAVSTEASAEAAACVKVLIASGSSSDANGCNGSTVEAPLTINIPNSQAPRASSEKSDLSSYMQGTNITVPVSVQKQPLPSAMSSENLDNNGTASGNLAPRRKRKPWSKAEDNELIAAVQKCGEGNWANILKGDFKGDRTASQLSQRWAIIRRRNGNISVGTGSQLTEAQLATRHVLALELNMQMGNNLRSASSISAGLGPGSHVTSGNTANTAAETSSAGTQSPAVAQQDPALATAQLAGAAGSSSSAGTQSPALAQQDPALATAQRAGPVGSSSSVGTQSPALSQQDPALATAQHAGPAGSSSSAGTQSPAVSQQDPALATAQRAGPAGSSRSRVATKNPSIKTTLSPDSMVKAAAVAAGARIVTPSDAASLLKAAQSKNAVHIMPGGGSLIKSSGAGTSQLPSNVHFMISGLAAKPLSIISAAPPSASRLGTTSQVPGNPVKPAIPVVQPNAEDIVLGLGASSQVANAAASNSSSEPEVKTVGERVNSSSDNSARGLCQKDHTGVLFDAPSMEEYRNRTSVSSLSVEQVQDSRAGFSGNSLNGKVDDKQTKSVDTEMMDGIQEDQLSVDISASNKQLSKGQVALPGSGDVVHLSCQTSANATVRDHTLTNGSRDSEDGVQTLNLPPEDLNNDDSELAGGNQSVEVVQGGLGNMDVDENHVNQSVEAGQRALENIDVDENHVERDQSKPTVETENGEK